MEGRFDEWRPRQPYAGSKLGEVVRRERVEGRAPAFATSNLARRDHVVNLRVERKSQESPKSCEERSPIPRSPGID